MYPDEANLVDEAFTYIAQAQTSAQNPPQAVLSGAHIDAIVSILDRWPLSQRFPGAQEFCIFSGYRLFIDVFCSH